MTWDNITLGQFIQYSDIAKIEDPIQRAIQEAMVFDNLTPDEIGKLTMASIKEYQAKYVFLNIEPLPSKHLPNFEHKGNVFKVLPLISQMETRKYLDFVELMKSCEDEEGNVDNDKVLGIYHNLIACFLICDELPYNNEAYSEAALTMPCTTALGVSAFFLTSLQDLLDHILKEASEV